MNFRRYFFLSILLVYSFELQAQLVALNGGLNVSNRHRSQDCIYLEFKPVFGYNFGVTYELEIGQNFFFVNGLRLSSIGYDLFPDQYFLTKDFITYKIQEQIYHFHYLNVPILFRYSYRINKRRDLFFVAGPYTGVAFTGSVKQFIQPEFDLSAPVTIEKNRLQTFKEDGPFLDFGFNIGAGIKINQWLLEINYAHGLRNYSTSYENVKTQFRSFSLNLGYYIKQ